MKPLKTKEVEIDGVIYTIKMIPYVEYTMLRLLHTDENGNVKKTGYISELFSHCITGSEITMENFNGNLKAGLQLTEEIRLFNESRTENELMIELLHSPLLKYVQKLLKSIMILSN